MEDVRDLKELQIDALREVANIGAGHAATALSQLTNRRIMISVPQINIVRLEEVPDLLGNPQDVVAAVLMHMLGDLTGRTLLLFPESVGRRVCDMLLRRPVGTTAVFDALEQSCLKEAGNILAGAYLNALSDFMGMLLLPSVPSLVVDLSAAVLTTTYQKGLVEDAVAAFTRALELAPKMQVAQRNLEIAYHDTGYYDRRVAQLQERLRQAPDDRDARWELGRAYAILGAHEEATAEFEQLLAHSPKDVAAIIQLGLAEKNRGRPEAATEWFRRAVQLNPPLARAQTNLSLERYTAERKSQERRQRLAPEPQVVEGNELAHYNLGLAFRQKGYYNEALKEYRLALERGEDRRLTLQAMAELHLLKRDLAAALELYDTLLREVPDSPKLWNERGVVLHQAGRPEDALASYRQAAEVDPKYALAWNNLGVVQAHGAAADPAIEAFRTALRLQGTFSAARLNLALVLFQLRRFQLALEAYRQVLSGEPNSAAAWNGVGLVLVELKRFPDARNAFVRAVEGDPDHAGAHYNLSFTLSNLGDFDGALRATKRALELDPYYVSQKFALTIDLQYEKGTIGIAPEISADVAAETLGEDFNFDQRLLDNIFQELAPAAAAEPPAGKAPDNVDALVAAAKGRAAGGDAAGALTALQQAQTRAPGRADLHKLQGDIAVKVGDKAGALAAYRSALELDRGYVQVWLDLGRLHEEKEELSEARKAYERALDVLPTFHEAALALADLLRRSGHVRAAIVRLAEMLEQDPYDLLALLLLGRALLDDKRDPQALEAFQRALKFDPDQVEALFQLGVALARLHRYGEAVQAWEKVTRTDPAGPFAQAARAHARTALDLKHIFASDAA